MSNTNDLAIRVMQAGGQTAGRMARTMGKIVEYTGGNKFKTQPYDPAIADLVAAGVPLPALPSEIRPITFVQTISIDMTGTAGVDLTDQVGDRDLLVEAGASTAYAAQITPVDQPDLIVAWCRVGIDVQTTSGSGDATRLSEDQIRGFFNGALEIQYQHALASGGVSQLTEYLKLAPYFEEALAAPVAIAYDTDTPAGMVLNQFKPLPRRIPMFAPFWVDYTVADKFQAVPAKAIAGLTAAKVTFVVDGFARKKSNANVRDLFSYGAAPLASFGANTMDALIARNRWYDAIFNTVNGR